MNENCDFTTGQKRLILCFYVRFGSLITALKKYTKQNKFKEAKALTLKMPHNSYEFWKDLEVVDLVISKMKMTSTLEVISEISYIQIEKNKNYSSGKARE